MGTGPFCRRLAASGLVALICAAPCVPPASAADRTNAPVRLRVFKLFSITTLKWQAPRAGWLRLQFGEETRTWQLGRHDHVEIHAATSGTSVRLYRRKEPAEALASQSAFVLDFVGGSGESEFLLSNPGKIERFFRGRLQVTSSGGMLQAVLIEDLDGLAAEVLGGEMSGVVEPAALQAQAVVARSFLAALRGRHASEGYDFCDTTHCQFTRGSRLLARHAAAGAATRGWVMAFQGRVLPANYAAVCNGDLHTILPGMETADGYPRLPIECPYCSAARRKLSAGQPVVSPLSGASNGHGAGLCQAGAVTMARRGATAREILAHFFPGAAIISLSDSR